mmetsp:Transcript_22891/g.58383  ORF Transcript_22891/g.58383 Transcript_22891/m.58383 type:complete len:144 (-) Transcript_22891:346-777(-)|eukprot:CAMPEP_0202869144 /NCGR_PEP_ID=MMETSP1391-20130828/11977_1 /ASSEMBLY_ACC=CAM_ASM_000867 /TAXON_ID=1034604 /ORGANISM="Chlamydomonas leiostraca, Strain SAG 11-49" /LENGTH=143 /DNA_ID=CAMNT_0049549409 /DNA_START=13 /DNA_END=444 /DNA_ORIENTATION=-
MSAPLYHLVAADLWSEAKQQGKSYFPPTYAQDGFIHLTADPEFLLGVGNRFYKNSPHKEWLLLVLDASKLSAKVVYEPAAPVGDIPAAQEPVLFPHLYGTIDYPAVIAEVPVERGADGSFLSIPGIVPAPEPPSEQPGIRQAS